MNGLLYPLTYKVLEAGSRVRVKRICEDDAWFEDEDGDRMVGEPATIVSHYPGFVQDGPDGTRGGCTIDFDRTLDEILGRRQDPSDDRMMVFADVELEVIQ